VIGHSGGVSATYIKLSGGTDTFGLASGTYQTGTISLGNDRHLDLTINSGQPVVLYVNGGMDLGGAGIVNPAADATKFILIDTCTGCNIHITNGAAFYGGIYAPTANVFVDGDADIYGAITAGTFTSGGSGKVHYDVQMKNVNLAGSVGMISTVYWHEKKAQ
jgi:hypothetical protein